MKNLETKTFQNIIALQASTPSILVFYPPFSIEKKVAKILGKIKAAATCLLATPSYFALPLPHGFHPFSMKMLITTVH